MRRHRAIVLAGIILLSAVLRIVAFRQLDRTPLLRMDRWAQSDMHYFDRWAQQIASGDWATASVPMPMHRWHREIAQRYFAAHPDALAEIQRTHPADPEAALWSSWMGTPRFYQDPLYSYIVAAAYRVVAADPRTAIALQLAVGILTNVLIWTMARRYFGDAAAAMAAALATLCAPLLFYECLLLRDSLVAFAGLALLWLADRALTRDRWFMFFALGIAFAFAFALKSTFLLLALGFCTVLIAVRLQRGAPFAGPVMWLIAGVAIGLSPLVVRNVSVGAPPLSLAASGPMTFVAANEARALPDVGFGIDAPVLASFLGDTDGGWAAAFRVAATGQGFSDIATRLWRKWDRAWHWFEIPNNENLYYMQTRAPVLDWLPVTFWTIAPLALVGLVLGLRRIENAWPLYVLVGTTAAALVLFYVLGRFRVSLIGATLPFAGLTLVELGRWIRAGRLGPALVTGVAIGLAAAWTGRPLADDQILIRTADWILPYSAYYQDRVYGALDRKDWNAAASSYLEFFAYEPGPAQILASSDSTLAPELADMHRECAQILRMAGRASEAEQQMARARDILALRPLH